MEYLFLALIALGIPFVLPIATWVSVRRTRARIEALEAVLTGQAATIRRLEALAAQARRGGGADASAPAPETAPKAPPPPAIVAPPPWHPVPPAPVVRRPPPVQAPRISTPPPPSVIRPPAPPFDWENLVGVKLFSAIAGIALVLAAIFFLKYSIEHGWLQPPIRVAIGMAVALALLVGCELKAARRYPSTANALDAAAIAILFATFYAAHALWNLIPSLVAFALLAVVTALAVLLSIRRGSLVIAVLGLLGGFATPSLLSSGENQPIPLFAYLMLLNIGLAWVAYRQRWAVLTLLTLGLTTVYQWGWVLRFLDASQLPLAMGIFALFPVITMGALMLARRGTAGHGDAFERTALVAAAMPLLFVVYLSAVPAYGAQPWLLFGFLLLIDVGLLAIAIARREEILHAAGAFSTIVVMAVWLSVSYVHAGAVAALVAAVAFAVVYSLGGALADRFARTFDGAAEDATYAAPLLLFVPAALARMEPAFANPWPLVAATLPVLLIVSWRAIVEARGALYFVAAFFAVAVQASWSSTHLAIDHLRTAVSVYALFGVVSLAVPMIARRLARPLEPRGGAGIVLIASLGLLVFLSSGPVAPVALWALALLLAILNAGLFVEASAGELPVLSIAGSIVSWLILAHWWTRAAGAVGILPSLAILATLSLVTLAGHSWAFAQARRVRVSAAATGFTRGLFLALGGHLFLVFLVTNPAWSLPPWPWMGTLAVLTMAISCASLVTRTASLHAAGAIAAALVVAVWTPMAGADWLTVAIAASLALSAFAVAWIPVEARLAASPPRAAGVEQDTAAAAAAGVLFVGEGTAVLAVAAGAVPFPFVLATHVINLATVLGLTWRWRWPRVPQLAILPAAAALLVQAGQSGELATRWPQLLGLSSAIYVVFIAYPLVLARHARGARDPYVAAVLASALHFFAAKAALNAGGYGWMVGALPVFEGAVMALLLRQLLALEPPGQRDAGRLALIGGTALAFVTVAIPLQLRHQWITIGWALEAAALAWLYTRVRHRGLVGTAAALFGAVFVRLAMNLDMLRYEPRGSMRIVNWYLYTYLVCAAAFLVAAWWLRRTDRTEPIAAALVRWLPAGAAVLLFLLLNIEIADFYATGPDVVFRFGVTVSQDLTYTIGWLAFGMILLGVCIYLRSHAGRIAALALIAVTTFKCFLYDLGSLGGLYRVGSFVGLATALALVSLALQKYVLAKPEGAR